MSYPQYPGGYQPYPQGVAQVPSGVTAIIAGVLACVGVIGQLFGGVVNIVLGLSGFGSAFAEYDSSGLIGESWFTTYALVSGILALITAIVLGAGGVMMFMRKAAGRMLVVAGCTIVVLVGIGGLLVTLSFVDSVGTGASSLGGVFGLIFPVATAVLALLPGTKRWLDHDPAAAQAAPAYPYGPTASPYGAPVQPYGAPQAYGAPQPYGPAPQQGAPQPYGAPPQPYAAPVAPYGAPVPPLGSDGAPNGTYPAPSAPGQYGVNPASQPSYPQPDSSNRQLDPTMKADGSQWQPPPSQ